MSEIEWRRLTAWLPMFRLAELEARSVGLFDEADMARNLADAIEVGSQPEYLCIVAMGERELRPRMVRAVRHGLSGRAVLE